jgi:hypothetical protein
LSDPNSPTDIAALLSLATRTAFHLEQRDSWQRFTDADRDSYDAFLATGEADAGFLGGWCSLVRETVGRGVEVRRLRLVSEPVSDYIRWEHALTAANLAAGEDVRWLPRSACMDLLVVPVDFWIVDSRVVRFGLFSGDGDVAGHQAREEPAIAQLVADCFEAAWSRAIAHEHYNPA